MKICSAIPAAPKRPPAPRAKPVQSAAENTACSAMIGANGRQTAAARTPAPASAPAAARPIPEAAPAAMQPASRREPAAPAADRITAVIHSLIPGPTMIPVTGNPASTAIGAEALKRGIGSEKVRTPTGRSLSRPKPTAYLLPYTTSPAPTAAT